MAQNNDAPARVEIFTPFFTRIFSTHFCSILFFLCEQFWDKIEFMLYILLSKKNKDPVIICTFQTFWQVICVFEKFSTIFLCDMKPQHSIFREKEQSVQLHISQKLANHKFIFSSFRNFFQKAYLKINFSSLCVFEEKKLQLAFLSFYNFPQKEHLKIKSF